MRILKKSFNVELIQGLKLAEFNCKCNHCRATIVCDLFLRAFYAFRTKTGLPILLTCGYRCQLHNKEVGGVAQSQHILGKAADFVLDRLVKVHGSPEKVKEIMLKCGFTYVYYDIKKNFIHGDVR